MWNTTLKELSEFMEQRAKLLVWQPLAKREHLKNVPLQDRIRDEYGAPLVVVVWLGQMPVQKRRPAASRVSNAMCANAGPLASKTGTSNGDPAIDKTHLD